MRNIVIGEFRIGFQASIEVWNRVDWDILKSPVKTVIMNPPRHYILMEATLADAHHHSAGDYQLVTQPHPPNNCSFSGVSYLFCHNKHSIATTVDKPEIEKTKRLNGCASIKVVLNSPQSIPMDNSHTHTAVMMKKISVSTAFT